MEVLGKQSAQLGFCINTFPWKQDLCGKCLLRIPHILLLYGRPVHEVDTVIVYIPNLIWHECLTQEMVSLNRHHSYKKTKKKKQKPISTPIPENKESAKQPTFLKLRRINFSKLLNYTTQISFCRKSECQICEARKIIRLLLCLWFQKTTFNQTFWSP